MELLEGGNLSEYVEKFKYLSEYKTKEIIKIIIDSVRYCHEY